MELRQWLGRPLVVYCLTRLVLFYFFVLYVLLVHERLQWEYLIQSLCCLGVDAVLTAVQLCGRNCVRWIGYYQYLLIFLNGLTINIFYNTEEHSVVLETMTCITFMILQLQTLFNQYPEMLIMLVSTVFTLMTLINNLVAFDNEMGAKVYYIGHNFNLMVFFSITVLVLLKMVKIPCPHFKETSPEEQEVLYRNDTDAEEP